MPRFMNLSPENFEFLKKFNFRCILCLTPCQNIHHIIPRSKAVKNYDREENKVPLCRDCHEKIHKIGAANNMEVLRYWRDKRLEQLRNFRE